KAESVDQSGVAAGQETPATTSKPGLFRCSTPVPPIPPPRARGPPNRATDSTTTKSDASTNGWSGTSTTRIRRKPTATAAWQSRRSRSRDSSGGSPTTATAAYSPCRTRTEPRSSSRALRSTKPAPSLVSRSIGKSLSISAKSSVLCAHHHHQQQD
ncbi:hypothetical protein H4S06_001987, partial [Coemansia sp. BCRC 34490]